ncbi:hypothetical protein P691DRAFT_781032 [Macrolepiota fuliginosa MF-IS2]|uniref:DUF6533 domain-containing protein n=1 Tax=Macrolepiota fuliginosa MF-IS2 TaxID=1400762 RepID=A0A9P5XEQ8_9AGAR|nr:hypothetical protein P691DRAFT_781032 [Macrolepiota fuliginosa MF-IS2]
MNPPADQLTEGVRQVQLYQYVDGIALAIYVYDYILTFSEEVELVWASNWTVMKTGFLLDRYLFVPNLIIQQFRLAQAYSCDASTASLDLSLFGVYLSGGTNGLHQSWSRTYSNQCIFSNSLSPPVDNVG